MKTIRKNQSTLGSRGGRRPGSGRKRGTANRRTREIADQALTSGQSPLEYLLTVMRTPKPTKRKSETQDHYDGRVHQWQQRTFDAAKAAAPYCHPRLAAVEYTEPEEDQRPRTIEVVLVESPKRVPLD